MNANITALMSNATLTMSSLEIAELLNKNHSDVRRCIDDYSKCIAFGSFERIDGNSAAEGGRPSITYYLNKKQSLYVVAQLSIDLYCQ